ncbi:hypothetical protein SKAU_G00419130 [Synaphobranchus kaupii]|uniref:Uncharacterized protein n=1 Tax=Synaphobranchus kaupii TaxID=118154 RepID=A0A9Q1IAY6_SYNKA|nr:hypothetical protein SKAU_G00419130 [Synaphobranchus kaupii]
MVSAKAASGRIPAMIDADDAPRRRRGEEKQKGLIPERDAAIWREPAVIVTAAESRAAMAVGVADGVPVPCRVVRATLPDLDRHQPLGAGCIAPSDSPPSAAR